MPEQKKKRPAGKSKKKHRGLTLFLLLCVLIGVWWYNNYTVKTVTEEFPSTKVKDPVRIMIVADLHATLYGISNDTLTEKVEEADPDFVVMLGDMYTRRSPWELIQIPIDLTSGIVQKGYPVYFVTGDHDTSKEYKEAISQTGAHLLDYKEEVVEYGGTSFQIMGIDNVYFSPTFDLTNEFTLRPDCFSLLLAHIPNYDKYAAFGADLTLCADTHGGMVQLPFGGGPLVDAETQTFLPKFRGDGVYYDKGWFSYDGGAMFITSGLGASPAPVRLNNRPEVVIIDIVPQ
ncbi:MAG: metallophosphoesterase [Ruminococcus sp.]|nr:metallophosphoesterase [Ruminococcus sp.]